MLSKKKVAIAMSVGSLKSCAAGISMGFILYYLLRNYVDVVAVAGSSGGAISAAYLATMHKHLVEDPIDGLHIIIDTLSAVKPKEIIDIDLMQQFLDRLVPGLSHFRKNSDFTGIVRGNALRKTFTKLYNNKTLGNADIPLIIPTTSIVGIPPYSYIWASHWDPKLKTSNMNFITDSSQPLANIVRASTAIPGVFRPERIIIEDNDMYLIDGGATELIPDGSLSEYLSICDIPCSHIISISTMRSPFGLTALPEPNDFFDTINAAYAMNYQLTYMNRQQIKHNLITATIGSSTSLSMTDTKAIPEFICKAIHQLLSLVIYKLIPSDIASVKNIRSWHEQIDAFFNK